MDATNSTTIEQYHQQMEFVANRLFTNESNNFRRIGLQFQTGSHWVYNLDYIAFDDYSTFKSKINESASVYGSDYDPSNETYIYK